MRRMLAAVLIALSAAAGLRAQAGTAPAAPPADPREAEAALLRADERWSDTSGVAGLVTGFVSGLAEGTLYLHPGAEVMRGRDRIRGFLAAQRAADGETMLRWTPLRSAVSHDGTGGYTIGVTVAPRATPAGRPAAAFGRYITFWRRADGEWRPVATMHSRAGARSPAPLPAGWTRGPLPDLARGGARRAVEDADRAFAAMAARSGAEAAFTAYAAPDAVSLGQAVVVGPAGHGAGLHGDTSRWAWGPVASGVSDDGELGFTVGEAAITGRGPDGRESTRCSKYLTIWQRQPDGTYRYLTDGGNARPACP